MKRILFFALVAILLITPLDLLHVLFGVRTLGEGAYWMTPLKFGLVGAILGLLSFCLEPKPHPSKRFALWFHGAMFVAAYAISAVFPTTAVVFNTLLVILLSQLAFSVITKVSLNDVLPFILILGIGGPLAEYIDVRAGGFEYIATPGTIPNWLPLLWANGAFFTRALIGKESDPNRWNWLGPFFTFIAPALQVIAMIWCALSWENIKKFGFIGSWKMALRLWGWRKE